MSKGLHVICECGLALNALFCVELCFTSILLSYFCLSIVCQNDDIFCHLPPCIIRIVVPIVNAAATFLCCIAVIVPVFCIVVLKALHPAMSQPANGGNIHSLSQPHYLSMELLRTSVVVFWLWCNTSLPLTAVV